MTPAPTTDFAGRVAIITGAARGLGLAAAKRLHERGASVAINVRDETRAQSATVRADHQHLVYGRAHGQHSGRRTYTASKAGLLGLHAPLQKNWVRWARHSTSMVAIS
ncbi:MAG: SDR family NAD(P)-dependent oxidoreductase [Phycisphaerae bacterium]|nr:SDR family NAD(P)-dependent oxidoreductase [Gemmatimonadaceae bacterium]